MADHRDQGHPQRDDPSIALYHLSGEVRRLPDHLQRKLLPHRRIESIRPGWTTPEKAEERRRLDRMEKRADWSLRFAALASVATLVTVVATSWP